MAPVSLPMPYSTVRAIARLTSTTTGYVTSLKQAVAQGQVVAEMEPWDPVQGVCIAFDQCPADVNEDQVVDALDILALIASYGSDCP